MYKPIRNSELLSIITALKPPIFLKPLSLHYLSFSDDEGPWLFGCLQGLGETEGGFCFRNCSQEARGWSCCESNKHIVSLLPTQTAIYQCRYVFLCYRFFGVQVLLMQESVKRIIDAEESKMGLWNALLCLFFITFRYDLSSMDSICVIYWQLPKNHFHSF